MYKNAKNSLIFLIDNFIFLQSVSLYLQRLNSFDKKSFILHIIQKKMGLLCRSIFSSTYYSAFLLHQAWSVEHFLTISHSSSDFDWKFKFRPLPLSFHLLIKPIASINSVSIFVYFTDCERRLRMIFFPKFFSIKVWKNTFHINVSYLFRLQLLNLIFLSILVQPLIYYLKILVRLRLAARSYSIHLLSLLTVTSAEMSRRSAAIVWQTLVPHYTSKL